MSSGHKTFFNFFGKLFYALNYQYNLLPKKNKKILLLLDEPDVFLHPDWQQKYINILINFLNINYSQYKFHIIITSHSPFILSDLPKENVIFLDKFDDETIKKYPKLNIKDLERGNCINLSSEMEDFNTFGANIHTLLSRGFFMKDGLMGEFAKEKINQVYNFIADNDTSFIKTKQEAQNIINLIGEPMLKKELQFLYDEKFEIDDIDKQIREHEEAIEKLKSKKKKND
ncbi:AAA family ATPase [Aliarcobacter cryaerophilus]|uniref:AAA family ATPase n=1 Tax=Aliarcobacter cryaerophilus TaxID=28198 RepID=UPI0021B46FC1|nr:AAA family ATPase [Aliarcobacter cryaerophilus]MCT7467699.1 AAA family ATPase [Aliarcobacter cryaerophilus]